MYVDDGASRGAIVILWLQRATTAVFGTLSLLVGLSLLASLPVLGVLSLGYLLVAGVRVLESGRLRDALSGLALFERLGAIALGVWLLLWLPRLFSSLADSARLIDPHGDTAVVLDGVAIGLAVLLGIHGLAACVRGCRLRHMLVPRPRLELRALRNLVTRDGYRAARDAVWDAVTRLGLPRLVRVGVLGLLAGAAWLLVPIALLALGSTKPLFAVIGIALVGAIVIHLPFLQLRVAQRGHLDAAYDIGLIRRAHARAPVAMGFAVLLTVACALPLYVLEIELIPRQAMWLPGIFFVALMLPARIACGWAFHRGLAADRPRHWTLRWLGKLVAVTAALTYGLACYFTQYISWYGTWGLFEQHAFLLPVPMFGPFAAP